MPAVEHEDPLYGRLEFTEAAARVVEHPAVQRLRRVHQNGGAVLANPAMDTTRFEHSLGVAALCERFGAPEREVIAALVHDVGHTAFSHVADHVFDRDDQAFHEDEVERIVDRYALDECLERVGYDVDTVLDVEEHPILERELPGLCADRLDYQLRDVHAYGLVDRATVDEILEGVTLENGRLVAADRDTARTLVDVSLLVQRQVFFDARHEVANLVLADLVETAIERGVLTVADLFRTDREVLDALREDPEFGARLDALGQNVSITRTPTEPQFTVSRKRRTMDPRVAGTGRRISDLDATVARKLSRFRESVPTECGYAIEIDGATPG